MENDPNPKPLPPASDCPDGSPPESVPRSIGLRQTLAYLIGLPLGMLVHFVLVHFVPLALLIFSDTSEHAPAVVVVSCCVVAIPLLWRPLFKGFAFGILLAVALTAVLNAQCSLFRYSHP